MRNFTWWVCWSYIQTWHFGLDTKRHFMASFPLFSCHSNLSFFKSPAVSWKSGRLQISILPDKCVPVWGLFPVPSNCIFFFQFSAALRLLLFLVDLLMLTFLGLRSRNDKFKLFFFTRSHTPLPSAILAVGPETRVLQKRNFLRTKKNILSSIDIHSVNSFLALNTEKSWQV